MDVSQQAKIEAKITNLLNSKQFNDIGITLKYDIVLESNLNENENVIAIEIELKEDILQILQFLKIDNGITEKEIQRLCNDKGYIIGVDLLWLTIKKI